MKKLGHFLFPFLSLITIAHGCGMSLHNEVTKRAMYSLNFDTKYNKYAKYLHNYPEFVQAGSFFPDWGFECMGNNDVSEAAHWPPFMRAGVEYIHEKYNNVTWEHDNVAQGVISFLFAIVSHGAADVTWHSIKMNSGFIRAMADLNFINDFPEAHTAADNGGEFTLSHMTNLDYLVNKWSFPIDDLVEIYRRINQTVDGKQIAGCAKRAFAAAHANKLFGKHFFALYGEKSPFLIEQIELYHKGGINNMAADVTDCWHEFAKWLETGTIIDIELCNTFHGKYTENAYQPSSGNLINFLYNHSADILETTGYVIRYHKKNGIGTFEIHRQSLRDQDFSASEEEENENLKVEEYGFDQIFQDIPTKEQQMSSLNEDIVFNEDEDIASINLPWANSDYLLSSYSYDMLNISQTPFNIKCRLISDDSDKDKVLTMNIPYSYSRFGHDIVVGDFNGDGIQDLAISAPFYQAGAIFIINGKKSGSFKTPKSTNIFDIADKIIYAYNNDDDPQLRFGWSMSVVDLNKDGIDDLAVSAPSFGAKTYTYNGKVYVYFGRKNKGLNENKADLEIIPKQDVLESEWQIEAFGQYMSSGDVDGDGFDDLLIGCPYCGLYNDLRSPRLLHTGGVFAFLSSSDHRGNITIYDYDWSIISPGDHQYEWFGTSIDYYKPESMPNPIIIVGAPGYVIQTQEGGKIQMSGRIYGFEMKEKVENGQIRKIPVKIFDLSGVEEFQGFGSSLIAGDFLENGEDFILIASNSEAYNKKFPRYGKNWQAGAIRLINMQYLKNESKTLSDDDMVLGEGLLALLRGSESASRFGSSLLWDNDEKSFWFSEPFTYWESGRIFKYSIGSLSGSSQSESIFSEGCFVGRERRARFGSKMIKFDFDGDGKKDLVVSSEHSSYAARLSGSVTIILD